MLVQQILNGKPSKKISTITADAKVSEAAEVLSSLRIGALVVSSDGETVEGMFSERDIVSELGKRGAGCMDMQVSELMTREIFTCSKTDTAHSVLQKMTDERVRHLPVMEGEKMIGLISIGDVVLARLSEMTMENQALEGMIKGF
ncbi:MAG: CBS domain-containing protein [Rhodobacteraceae bacterium]|nr:CBS domain-containing protein [Paracoccaceae bacterium]